ncbi:LCP family protein [Enterocloster lavalensis]|uniref:LCP family protein n=1 Tax=Enterocloster lavalensis TaxID=460384 RepID=UPI001F2993E0|nr:LCP family protein [Enterocloster lavalensis]
MNREFESGNGFDQEEMNGAGQSRRRPAAGRQADSAAAGRPSGIERPARPAGGDSAGRTSGTYRTAGRAEYGAGEAGAARRPAGSAGQTAAGDTAGRRTAAAAGGRPDAARSRRADAGAAGGYAGGRAALQGAAGRTAAAASADGRTGANGLGTGGRTAAGAAGAGSRAAGGAAPSGSRGQMAGGSGGVGARGQMAGGSAVTGARSQAAGGSAGVGARGQMAGGSAVAGARGQMAGGSTAAGARGQMAGGSAVAGARGQAAGGSTAAGTRTQAANGSTAAGAKTPAAGRTAAGARTQAAGGTAAGPRTQSPNGTTAGSRPQTPGAGATGARRAGQPGNVPGTATAAGRQGAAAGQRAAGGDRPRFKGETGGAVGARAAGNGTDGWIDLDESGPKTDRKGGGSGNGGNRGTGGGRGNGGGSGKQSSENRYWRKVMIGVIVVELLFLALLFLVIVPVKKKLNSIQRNPNINMAEMTNPNLSYEKVESMKGFWTVALFGVDSRNNSLGKGNNADVNIICNINQDSGEIKLVSVFRDSYLNIDEEGSYNKINQAYFKGGPDQAVKALNRNLDLEIDDYAVFNWKAVIDAINILGGVDIELSKAEFYYINAFITETVQATGVGSVQLTHAGMNHMDGVQAVAYARLRKMDTDFARTERQRKVIQLAFDKLKKADFAVVNNVMEVVLGQIESSVDLNDLIPLAKTVTKFYIGETTGFPQARGDLNMGKKGDCVIPQTLESNVVLLHQFLFGDDNYEPSEMVKKISSKIAADSGLYKEGKPIDHVGTDGGYIPKPTQAPKATTAAETEEENEEKTTAFETEPGIIDGEFPDGLELETDEFGNVIDPPEDEDPRYPGGTGTYPGGGTGSYPGGGTRPSQPGSDRPTSSSTAAYPGAGATTSPDDVSGPGAATAPTRSPYNNNPTVPSTTRASEPTENNSTGGPGSVILGPGGNG